MSSCLCQVSKVNEKDLQDQQCEYSPQALPEPTSTISCLHDRFLDGPLLPTPHLYFLYFELLAANGFGTLVNRSVHVSLTGEGSNAEAVPRDVLEARAAALLSRDIPADYEEVSDTVMTEVLQCQ